MAWPADPLTLIPLYIFLLFLSAFSSHKWPRKLNFSIYCFCALCACVSRKLVDRWAEISYNEFKKIEKEWQSLSECALGRSSNCVFFLFVSSANRVFASLFPLWSEITKTVYCSFPCHWLWMTFNSWNDAFCIASVGSNNGQWSLSYQMCWTFANCVQSQYSTRALFACEGICRMLISHRGLGNGCASFMIFNWQINLTRTLNEWIFDSNLI